MSSILKKAILIYYLKIVNEIVIPLVLIFITRYLTRFIDPNAIKPLEIEVSADLLAIKGTLSFIDVITLVFGVYFALRVVCRSERIILYLHRYLQALMQTNKEDY